MEETKPKILAIIITYNRPKECARLLDSLNNITSHRFDVFLIENLSESDYKEVLSKKYNFRIIYEKMDDNYGLSITHNKAIIYAIKNDYDYTWVLDDDTVVDKDALKYMVEEMQGNEQVAVTGSAIYDLDKKGDLLHTGAFVDFKKVIHFGIAVTDKVSDVDYVADCSSLTRVSLIKKHKIFYDESYFLHVEDMDFPLMFKQLGYKITVDPKSKVYHRNWYNIDFNKSYICYYYIRNPLYMYMKFEPEGFKKSNLIESRTNRNIYHFLFTAGLAYIEGDIPLANAFYYAVKDFYNCKMYKTDFYKRINLSFLKEKIKNKTIVFPDEFIQLEYDKISGLLSKHAENCKITHFNHQSRVKRIMNSLLLFKKFDYVIIPSPTSSNLLYPLLGKRIVKLENNNLCIYSLNYFSFIKFASKVIYLLIKVAFKKTFRFNQWRKNLIWTWEKNENIVATFSE